jgi:hypothetical protein
MSQLGKDRGLSGHPRASLFANSPENREKCQFLPHKKQPGQSDCQETQHGVR